MRTNYFIIPFLSMLLFSSCNYLDYDETSGLKTKEDMYKYFDTSKQMLTHVYSFMPQGSSLFSGSISTIAMLDCASDDAEFGAVADDIQLMNNGGWSAINTYDDSWSLYNGIRAANSFIIEIAQADFTRYEHNGSYQNWMKQLQYFPYEARVLRAYYFFELARRYGDIAMPLAVLTEEEANTIGKTAFADVIQFIVDECDAAATDGHLPESYAGEPGQEIGRVTKGFAMALKSKALLYAASELHNPSMDQEAWKKSAMAALDIINLGLYSLDPDGCANNLGSKETVFMKMNGNSNAFELYNYPIRLTKGERSSSNVDQSNYPSQNLVDAFETANGYKVTLENTGWTSEDPAFDAQNPYANRDKRFYRTILYNGLDFKNEGDIQVFEGGRDYNTVTQGGTPTGYFLRKYIQESTDFTPGNLIDARHYWVVYRYAETLLTYAESMVNAFNDVNYTDSNYPYSALWAINQVRANADMPAIPSCSKDEFMERLYNEWRVEFAFEDHRFWDVRRWKIADSTQRELYGVKIEKQANGTLYYYKNLYETRTWKDCMYLYPIPQSELFKNTNLYPQNTGW